MHQRNPHPRQSTDRRQWEAFDKWLERYERATGADAWHSRIPGGPRGY